MEKQAFIGGNFQIKIHRSNFWFYGQPKKSRLIETLIHEFRTPRQSRACAQ